MRIDSAGKTDVGLTRENNEDFYQIDEALHLYVVADGMGGHAAGEVASRLATESVFEDLRARRDEILALVDDVSIYRRLPEIISETMTRACGKVYERAVADSDLAGMGTTMTLLLIVGDTAVMGHVGDSQLYLQRSGEVTLLSTDHTLARQMLGEGTLDQDELHTSPYANVLTRCLGTHRSVQVDTLLFDLFPGDTCLLCSDGLSRYVLDPSAISDEMASDDLTAGVDALLEFANRQGGVDNSTAILLRASGSGPESPRTRQASLEDLTQQLEILRRVFLFDGLSLKRLLRFRQIVQIETRAPGETLISEGDSSDAMTIVLDGKLTISRKGKDVGELNAGSYFGELTLIRRGVARASVRAAETTKTLRLPRAEYRELMRKLPRLAQEIQANFLEYLADGYDELVIRLVEHEEDEDEHDEGFFSRLLGTRHDREQPISLDRRAWF